MNDIRNIVIVGGEAENPSRFSTRIEPVKLGKACEMALTSLVHGEIFNIHNKNNKVYFYHGLSTQAISRLREGQSNSNLREITIPEGTYSSSAHLCLTIANLITLQVRLPKRKNVMNITVDKQNDLINIDLIELYIVIEGKSDTPWFLLNVFTDKNDEFSIQNKSFKCTTVPAFVYADIVENSYINGKLTRNLTVLPVKNNCEWTFYEPKHPNFVPITVREFSKILIELRDVHGRYIKFNPIFKTIITLIIRPIKANDLSM